jgi:recombination associated protein RdgC
MWFNNTLIYQYELDQTVDLAGLLLEERLKPCPPHARFIYGWVEALANELIYEIVGCSLICLGKEERILPRSVVQRHLSEKIKTLEEQRGFAVKRAEKGQMAEDIEFELLPKSFCLQKKQQALLDSVSQRLIINTSSANQAAQLTAHLRKSIPGISINPLNPKENLASTFANWIKNPKLLPANLELASNCLLFSEDNENKQFNCKGYELPADEVHSLLSQGLLAAEISLIWNERIQFTLTHNLAFKRLKCLDYLVDEFHDLRELDDDLSQQDAAMTLLTHELRGLFNDLLPVLTNESQKAQQSTAAICDI